MPRLFCFGGALGRAGLAGYKNASHHCCGAQPDAAAPERAAQELLALSCRAAHLVCVCDDIFRDGAAYDEWAERYRSGLACVCRTLAAEFDTVCEVTAGLPHLWKGELP